MSLYFYLFYLFIYFILTLIWLVSHAELLDTYFFFPENL